jgi:hypothetical protein
MASRVMNGRTRLIAQQTASGLTEIILLYVVRSP